jgi:hypothetical protein
MGGKKRLWTSYKTLEGEYNQSNVPLNSHKRNIPIQLAEKGGQKGQF